MSDKWVMVRLTDLEEDWVPRIMLYDFGDIREYRYLCFAKDKSTTLAWRDMRPAKAIELLSCLPGEWAKRAILRVNEYPLVPNTEVGTLAEALYHAIRWGDTPEDHHAWHSLHEALLDGTEAPKCPLLEDTMNTVEPAKSMTATSMEMFELELIELINSHCIESVVDMPDFLLARMICSMIEAMGPSIKKTLDWHGCDSVCHPAPSDDKEVTNE